MYGKKKRRKVGGAQLAIPWPLSLNAKIIEPTTARAVVSSLSMNTNYPFLHLSGLGRVLQPRLGANSDEV